MNILRSRTLGTSCLAAVMSFAALTPLALTQDDDTSRQEASLADDQAFQRRQLRRLKDTMTSLAGKLDAEGRVHAAKLLRDGLEHLKERPEKSGKTVDELMDAAREDIREGRTNTALDHQEQIIENLARLLEILMDRQSLENIEQDLEELREIKAALGDLADEEQKLREETEQLREDSANPAQKALQQAIEQAISQQRELLEQNESGARQSGLMDLEQLKARLDQMIQEQNISSEVFEAWSPEGADSLAEAREPLEAARQSEAQAERLDRAARELRGAAQEAREGAESAESAQAKLEQAAEREGRAARTSGDEAAKKTSAALEQSAQELAEASDDAQRAEAARQAEERASALEQAA
ncbi:MAG: hypothetical protein O2816_18750, partial [Planctomycetota bacterium]|nr:hypothetical protein [Planctomycetota bacterium]